MGSILESAKFIERVSGRNVFVWGAGSKGLLNSCSHLGKAEICSVRGPLTRSLLLRLGVKAVPEIYGDPALLVPYLWDEVEVDSRHGPVLVIPHYKELDLARKVFTERDSGVFEILDPRSPIAFVIKAVAGSSAVLSSSLHGLILADAYGVRSSWLSFSDRLGGGDFKFDDHHLGIWGRKRRKFVVRGMKDVDCAAANVERPPRVDINPIINSFPFRLVS
ncbi:polysaccharide pyruvyl transferase family protein [Arhodomonas sp. SL1]|uniref:polysaccharide pyruvyl transferase family protein n=1 Tax=Arhodomonas sp. SL1 TaxID=3425691 RepID=UPI003F881579